MAAPRARSDAAILLADEGEAYRAVFDHAPLPMWIFDAETLRFLEANAAAVRQYGYTREELLGFCMSDVIADRSADGLRANLQKDAAGDTIHCVARHRTKFGTIIEVEIAGHAVTFAGRPARLVIARDVTAQRRAEAALIESERRSRAQFMAMPIPTYAWRRIDADFELVDFNAAAESVTRGSIREWIGRCASEVFADQTDYAAGMRRCLEENRPLEMAVPHRMMSSGATKDFAVTFVPVGRDLVLVHTVDDTERLAAEHALRSSEERFRALTENANELVAILGLDGRFEYASPSYSCILGYDPRELIGVQAADFVHPDDAPIAASVLGRVLEHEGKVFQGTMRVRARDGSYRLIEVSGQNLVAHPAVRGIVANGRDVSERDRLANQLRQSQKLEAVGRLAGGVAHDFNNLLTVIGAHATFLLQGLSVNNPLLGDARAIQSAGERAAALTRQLLAFSRKQMLRPSLTDLNSVVDEANRMIARLVGEDVEIALALTPDLPPVMIDAGQIEQVLMNLVINARDAMPTGGRIAVATRYAEVRDETCGREIVPPGRYVILSVADSGVGMTAETQARIFEPFFTTKEIGKGTGLGLATVYGIVKQSAGYILLESEEGRGTTFEVYFPRLPGSKA